MRIAGDAIDDRGVDDCSVAVTAGGDNCALGLRIVDQFVHSFGRREIDERPEHDMAAWVAARQTRGAFGELAHERIGDGLVDN
jgi:hypothetical protein